MCFNSMSERNSPLARHSHRPYCRSRRERRNVCSGYPHWRVTENWKRAVSAKTILYIVILNSVTAVWVAFEIWLIVRDRIQGKGTMGKDRGTIYLNFLSLAVGMTAAGLIGGYTKFGFSGQRTGIIFWIGLLTMGLGLALRVWAVAALGASFRTTIETHENQKVKKDGPYRLIRHPSYSGLLLICGGYGLATRNWLSLVVALGLPLLALLYRIRVEEKTLVESLGAEYEEYRKHTKRLIPWIW